MPISVDLKGDKWSFGAEHELADWDTSKPLCERVMGRSKDHTVVNSNGIAAQPNTEVYKYGGEMNTSPSWDIDGQVRCLEEIEEYYPNAKVNHRSNLHLHIRVPGLKSSLPTLKKVQRFIHTEFSRYIDDIEPIPKGQSPSEKKRAKRRKVSHHTFLTAQRLNHQLEASSVQDFFEREVLVDKKGKLMWHAQPRVCVNLRQLIQTDTVEFRHFPGTMGSVQLRTCLEWCFHFMKAALTEAPLSALVEKYTARGGCFPSFPEFDEEREVRYQATAATLVPTQEIKTNIALILKGKFNATDSPDLYQKYQERAGVVSR